VEDVHLGEVGPDRLLDRIVNYCHLWCPPSLRVLSGLYLCKVDY
jgi:hypothetical protein